MKAVLLAVAVIVVVIGAFAYVVYTDPNRAQTRAAYADATKKLQTFWDST